MEPLGLGNRRGSASTRAAARGGPAPGSCGEPLNVYRLSVIGLVSD
jgi:hypothetical protein